jgi:3'-phosphoadenosine 5'-phosphosulfate sulfotransferase (PAPS reductase)/FAD synthetase
MSMSTPDLTSFDIILVNTSAGKDSQAMLDYVVEQATIAGVRDRVVAVHADLGRVEWAGTAELAEEQVAHYGLRFIKVSRPQGDLLTHIERHGMFPGSQTRFCTSDHKRGQVRKVMTALVRELGIPEVRKNLPVRPARILNCMGLRAQESDARAKKVETRYDKSASGKGIVRQVTEWLPILDWKVEDVWARIAQAGTRYHWAYDEGMPRLSCCFCVFAPKSQLVRSAQLNPELAAEYAAVEVRIGHIFRGKPGTSGALSMAEVIELAKTETVEVIEDWAA